MANYADWMKQTLADPQARGVPGPDSYTLNDVYGGILPAASSKPAAPASWLGINKGGVLPAGALRLTDAYPYAAQPYDIPGVKGVDASAYNSQPGTYVDPSGHVYTIKDNPAVQATLLETNGKGPFDPGDPLPGQYGYTVDSNGHLSSNPAVSQAMGASSMPPDIKGEITGGYVWARTADGRWVPTGRAPNNPPAFPQNMVSSIMRGIGNQWGQKLGLNLNVTPPNGLDNLRALNDIRRVNALAGLPIPEPMAPAKIYNPDLKSFVLAKPKPPTLKPNGQPNPVNIGAASNGGYASQSDFATAGTPFSSFSSEWGYS